jgi:hypothetical protein
MSEKELLLLDEEAKEEYKSFTKSEKEVFASLLVIFDELGRAPLQAERDAAASVLEHRRMATPLFSIEELAAIREAALKYVKKGFKPGAAERKAFSEAVAEKKG